MGRIGISWTICKSFAPHSRQITMPVPHHSVFLRTGCSSWRPTNSVKADNQEGKTNLDLLEQEIVSGSGISWAICKCAPWARQTTMPASHHSVFNRLDAHVGKHWRLKYWRLINNCTVSASKCTKTVWQPYFMHIRCEAYCAVHPSVGLIEKRRGKKG